MVPLASHLLLISTTAIGAALGCAVIILLICSGLRSVSQFTRPGVAITPDSPFWGDWKFPDDAEPEIAERRSLTFTARDGTTLHGEFWAQPQPAPTMIISHGFHVASMHFRSVAALEYRTGVNILLFDYRGHGASALVPTTCGNAEVQDLQAALDVAMRQPETLPGKIFIHGFSMGAAVALLLPPHEAVAGIIADSPYARLTEMVRLVIQQIFTEESRAWHGGAWTKGAIIAVLTQATFIGGRIIYRLRFRRPLQALPERAMRARLRALAPAPVLLIHAERDPLIDFTHARRLANVAHATKRMIQEYYTPCAIHCGSYGYDPQRYNALIARFIAA